MKKLGIVTLVLTLCLTACALNQSQGGAGVIKEGMDDGEYIHDTESKIDVEGGKTNLSESVSVRDVVSGNSANNLLRSMGGICICFGNDRVYFVSEQKSLCSVAMDGSDYICHGEIGSFVSEENYLHFVKQMNYYDGYIYYIQNDSGAGLSSIRRIFPDTGADEEVVAFEEENMRTSGETIRILNDDLFYAITKGKQGKGETRTYEVGVINLKSGERKSLETGESYSGAGNYIVDTDGVYIYYYIPNSWNYCIKRILWDDIYKEDVKLIQVIDKINSPGSGHMIFADNGLYTSTIYNSQDPINYIHYDYNDIASDGTWTSEDILLDISSQEFKTEEELIENLVYHSNVYIMDDAILALSLQERLSAFFYSASLDYRQAENVGSLDLRGVETIVYGEYDGRLYIIYGEEGAYTVHYLDKAGVYH